MSYDEWQKVRWNSQGVAEKPEHQATVNEFLAARAAGSDHAIRGFIESLGVAWQEAPSLPLAAR